MVSCIYFTDLPDVFTDLLYLFWSLVYDIMVTLLTRREFDSDKLFYG